MSDWDAGYDEGFSAGKRTAEAALAECERERDRFKGESDTLRAFLHTEEARTTKAENSLDECEREKVELKRQLSSALHQWHNSDNKLAAAREALQVGISELTTWLDVDECDCEEVHHCGRDRVKDNRLKLVECLAALSEADEQR